MPPAGFAGQDPRPADGQQALIAHDGDELAELDGLGGGVRDDALLLGEAELELLLGELELLVDGLHDGVGLVGRPGEVCDVVGRDVGAPGYAPPDVGRAEVGAPGVAARGGAGRCGAVAGGDPAVAGGNAPVCPAAGSEPVVLPIIGPVGVMPRR